MKKIFLLLLFFSLNFYCQAQDYVVTVKGDTFDCKITRISERFIHFDYVAGNELRSTVILLDQVVSYNKSVAKPAQVPNPPMSTPVVQRPEENANNTNNPAWGNQNGYSKVTRKKGEVIYRLNFFGGYSHLTAKGDPTLTPDQKAYEDELRSGSHFGGSFQISPAIDKVGFGVKFNSFNTSHSGFFSFYDNILNEQIEFEVEDNINMTFIGPHITTRNRFSNSESAFLVGFSLGYFSYVNNASIALIGNNSFIERVKISGEGLGVMIDMGVDIHLTDNIFLNLEANYLLNSLSEISVGGNIVRLKDDEIINNSHINIGAGISFVIH